MQQLIAFIEKNKLLLAVLGGIILFSAVVTLFLTYTPHGGSGVRSVSEQLQPDGSLPYTDLEGNPVDLSSFNGKLVVINSWASWCPFCKEELPFFSKLADEFKDKGVVVIAINRAETAKTATAYLSGLSDTDSILFLLDQGDNFYKSVQGYAMPETIIYRKDGTVAFHKRGSMTLSEMEESVQNASAPISTK